MSVKTRVEALLENLLKLRLQGVNMRDARRARRHPFCLLLFEFDKIEIEAAICDLFGAREGFVGNGEKRNPWREGERFLRASEHDVDAERVHADLDAGER